MAESILLFGQVYGAVDVQPAAAAIKRNIALRSYDRIFDSFFLIFFGQEMGKLQYHIRLGRHLGFLEISEVLRVYDFGALARRWVLNVEENCTAFFHQHYPPRKAVSLF